MFEDNLARCVRPIEKLGTVLGAGMLQIFRYSENNIQMLTIKRWLRDPLIHFIAAGALLFVVHAWLNRGDGGSPRVVHITAGEVNWLRTVWSRQWHRSPNDDELRGIVSAYLKERMAARDAQELGLDENDPVIRRRLAQKMEFLVQDSTLLAEPNMDELRSFYELHRARYQVPAQVSFTQIFFKTEDAARANLQKGENIGGNEPGDTSLLPGDVVRADREMVENSFGRTFASKVFALGPGQWHGPILSSYGFHLVQIRETHAAQVRSFDEVRAKVASDWYQERTAKAKEQYFRDLLKKYEVVADEGIKPLIESVVKITR